MIYAHWRPLAADVLSQRNVCCCLIFRSAVAVAIKLGQSQMEVSVQFVRMAQSSLFNGKCFVQIFAVALDEEAMAKNQFVCDTKSKI